jgi:hypothetical protein
LPLYKGFMLKITNKWWPLTTLNRWPLYRIKIYRKTHWESTKVTALQNTTHTTKDWVTWTLLRAGYELRCSGRVSSSCSTSDTCHVIIKGNDHHLTCDAAFKYEVDSYQVSSISAIYNVTQSLVVCVVFCRSLFVRLSFFFWRLCCLFFDLQLLITPLVSTNLSYRVNISSVKRKRTNGQTMIYKTPHIQLKIE